MSKLTFSASLSPAEMLVVWTALQQFVDNQDVPDDGSQSQEAQTAQGLIDRIDAVLIPALEAA